MKVFYDKDADLSLIKGKSRHTGLWFPRSRACEQFNRIRRESDRGAA